MLQFFKMQGIGNDYIYIDQIQNNKNLKFENLAKVLCRRCYEIGSDGIVLIRATNKADAKMVIYNSDGSLAKMCGNATRCVAFYLSKKLKKNNIQILVGGQIVACKILNSNLKNAKVEVVLNMPKIINRLQRQIKNDIYEINVVDVGNLHAVVFVRDFDFDILQNGELINKLIDFKNGVNVEFVKVLAENKIKIKVFERGSGLTKACGSGACACAYVYKKLFDKNTSKLQTVLDGGELEIGFEKNKIKMIGDAKYVYKGEY